MCSSNRYTLFLCVTQNYNNLNMQKTIILYCICIQLVYPFPTEEDFFLYWQNIDFCLKVRLSVYVVLCNRMMGYVNILSCKFICKSSLKKMLLVSVCFLYLWGFVCLFVVLDIFIYMQFSTNLCIILFCVQYLISNQSVWNIHNALYRIFNTFL